MADFDQFGYGASVYPLTSSTSSSLLRDADPALFYLLEFLSWGLGHYLDARITAATNQVPSLSIVSRAVAYSTPLNPAPFLTQQQFKFPLLAIYRVDDELRDQSQVWRTNDCTLAIEYVLPPLDSAQAEQLIPLLKSARDVVDRLCRVGHHPSFTPTGGTAGAGPFGPSFGGIAAIDVKRAKFGAYPNTEGKLDFPAVVLECVMTERTEPVTGALEAFKAADVHVDSKASDTDTTLTDLVVVDTSVG